MIYRRLPLFFLSLTALPWSLAAVETGDTREAVLAELGAPMGSAGVGARTVLFFARGEVTLQDNRVVAVNLVSAEELAARQEAETAAIQRMEAEAQARLARLEAEGRAIYAAKKVDATFAALPAVEQLNYWRAFASRYPMIAVAAEIAPLAERVEDELYFRELELGNDERLADLEARVDDVDERARRAEREARRDRYGYPYIGRPVHPRPPHRPIVEPRATPVLNPIDASRADAMAEIEAVRQRAYTGGTPVKTAPRR
jgi:hypothetical protein